MSSEFEYKPRFKDMRIKPPRPEEEAAEADVLHLKPGEKPCQWPDFRAAATARAPKSRIAHAILAHALALFEAKHGGATVTPIKQAS